MMRERHRMILSRASQVSVLAAISAAMVEKQEREMRQKLDALDKMLDALNSAERAKKDEIKCLGAQLMSLKNDIAAESKTHERALREYHKQSAEIEEQRKAAIMATQQAGALLAALRAFAEQLSG